MNTNLRMPDMSLALALVFALSASSAFAANDDDQPIVGTPSISESTALGTATKAYTGNGTFTDIELEMEGGVLVYGVEFTESDGNEVDVKINAKTGAVVVIESDQDEAEDDDAEDVEEDGEDGRVATMETLIRLLNQLLELLRAR